MPTAQINGIPMHYQIAGAEHGESTPLLLIHGLGSSSADWQSQLLHYGQQYRVIAPDLRGHGRSGQPPGPYRISQFSDDIAALLQALGVASAHIVGISLGGAVAFQFALDHPARVSTLTIVNSAPEMILRRVSEKLAIWQRLAIIRLLGLPRMGRVLATRLFPKPEHAGLREGFATRFASNQRAPYLASLRALIGWSVSARLDQISCPTLVICADQDYTPVALKQAYTARLANARLVVIADSHHALPMEQPEAFNRVLGEFLSERR